MKIRLAFVSNSSSSSYTCDFCGESVSGWDMCLSDADMVECKIGHGFCLEHCIDEEDIDKEVDDWRYEVDPKHCPMCQFQHIKPDALAKYLLKKLGTSEEEVLDEIKDKFKDFKEFKEFIEE